MLNSDSIEEVITRNTISIADINPVTSVPDFLNYGCIYFNLYSLIYKEYFSNKIDTLIPKIIEANPITDLTDIVQELKGSVLIKTHTDNIRDANRKFNTFSPRNVSCKLFSFLIDLTRPNIMYDVVVLSLPTVIGKGIEDFVYILSCLFGSIRLIKHTNSLWFQDSFVAICNKPNMQIINDLKNSGKIIKPLDIISIAKQITFKESMLSDQRIDSFLDSPKSEDFIKSWKSFRSRLVERVHKYHTLIDNIDNPSIYKIFFKEDKLEDRYIELLIDEIEKLEDIELLIIGDDITISKPISTTILDNTINITNYILHPKKRYLISNSNQLLTNKVLSIIKPIKSVVIFNINKPMVLSNVIKYDKLSSETNIYLLGSSSSMIDTDN